MTKITKKKFANLPDGREVDSYLVEDGNYSMTVLTYGGAIQKLKVPDKSGKQLDIVLGFDEIDGYINNDCYVGSLVGRCGNRIEKGNLQIDGKKYDLYKNNMGNHLNGGKEGFDKRLWTATVKGDSLILEYTSPEMEENYPGNVKAKITYTLKGGKLSIDYFAVSDKKTAINFTHHGYYNLDGEGLKNDLDTELYLEAPRITPTDEKNLDTTWGI